LSYLFANHIVNLLKWIEDGLIKITEIDLLFGSIGLILGLLITYLINIPITDIDFRLVYKILSLFFSVIIWYLGFQVGFRRREEFMGILTRNRKDKRKDNVEIEPETKSGVQVKILDTSVIIDGRIADVIQTHFLEGTIVIPQF